MRWEKAAPAAIIAFMALYPVSAQSTPPGNPVSIENFTSGVEIPQEEGYEVSDFEFGQYKVNSLFKAIPIKSHGTPGTTGTLLIKVNNEEALAELKQKSLSVEDLKIGVVMHKEAWNCHLLGGWISIGCNKRREIPFTLNNSDPCQAVTRIIYLALGDKMTKEMELQGDSHAPITLDQAFSILLADKAEDYIRTKLSPIARENQCFKEFALYKWLRNEEIEGYEPTDYSLHEGLRSVLRGIASALGGMKMERYYFQIEIIGYADQTQFQKPHPLSKTETNITTWNSPFAVYYTGCRENHLLLKMKAVTIGLDEKSMNPVDSEINDNCELGATRAFIAATYLKNMLGTYNIDYRYGTGGMIETDDRSKDYLNRKVEIRVIAKSAQGRLRARTIRLITN